MRQQKLRATLPDRVYASIPAHDQRFAELRAFLQAQATTGQSSPIPREMGEFALLGFLFLMGRFSSGGPPPDLSSLGITDPAELAEAQKYVIEAVDGLTFD